MIIYAFGISRNVSESYEENSLNAAAITTKSEYFNNIQTLNLTINDNLAENLAMPKYVSDFYTIEELAASSNNVKPVPNNISRYEGPPIYFRLALYSDIDKSIDFVTGKREITKGRYAVKANECNISSELAVLNGFTIGSAISLNIWDTDKRASFEVVGIFTDETAEVGGELDFIMSVHNTSGSASASMTSDRRNDILTISEAMSGYNGTIFKTVLYYIHDENSLNAFKEEISTILPAPFMILDNLGTINFIRQTINGTRTGYLWLLGIIGTMCSIFYVLIILNNFKNRVYDIGVLRSRGLSRINTALLFSFEVFIISSLAFIAAGILYSITFVPFTEFIYNLQRNNVNNLMWYQRGVSIEIANNVLNYSFNVSLSALELAGGFLISLMFAVTIGFAGILFISRNEPIKTMIEY
jgi:putative ABC transport system permease protein